MLAEFLAASVLLTLAPGPDIMYLLTLSLASGARYGVMLSSGLCSGVLFHTTLVIVGVAALVQQSPAAFAALKYVGAAYLLLLAWKSWRGADALSLSGAADVPALTFGALYRRGVLMNALNPKVLLFFLAFLPQFVSPERGTVSRQIALLGLLFAVQAFMVHSVVAFCAGKLRDCLLRRRNLGRILAMAQSLVLVVIATLLLFF